ncbi:MAG: TonB-dependent receptor, partial [Gemmatimonadetes bacterium]|nr:TonB-dependent receptor [Gemmatimonadota bacterium]
EQLFVGDAGTTEPSDASRRVGVTWTNFNRLTPNLTVDFDVSFARARFARRADGEAYIPGALESVVTAGLSWAPGVQGPYASLRLRHFGAYPLVEDNSVRAAPSSLVSASAGWALGALRIGVSVLNLLDSDDSDIEYFYESRLPGEPAGGLSDVHFHSFEPRQVRLTASWGL